jgi:Flp pilus assembly pilin Flp
MAVRERVWTLALRFTLLARRLTAREGQGMVEYAMIAMVMGLALLAIVAVIGKQTDNMYSNISNGFNGH